MPLKLTKKERARLVSMLPLKTDVELASHFGLTREWVRVIRKKENLPSSRVLGKLKTEADRVQTQANLAAQRENNAKDSADAANARLKHAEELWNAKSKNGEYLYTVAECAEKMSSDKIMVGEKEVQRYMTSGSFSIMIVRLRKEFPDRFPARPKGPRTRQDGIVRPKRVRHSESKAARATNKARTAPIPISKGGSARSTTGEMGKKATADK